MEPNPNDRLPTILGCLALALFAAVIALDSVETGKADACGCRVDPRGSAFYGPP